MQNRFLGAVLALVAGAMAAPAPKPATCEVKVSIRGEWKGAPDTAAFMVFDVRMNHPPKTFAVRLPMDTTIALEAFNDFGFAMGFGRGEIVGPLIEIRGRKGVSYGACLTSGSLCEVVRKDVTLRENCSID